MSATTSEIQITASHGVSEHEAGSALVEGLKGRAYQPADYPMLASWWTGHGGAAVPQAMLPEFGAIVSAGTEDQAAAFVYFDNSRPLAVAAWFITKPSLPANVAERALQRLVAALEHVAKEHGRSTLLPLTDKASLIKWLTKRGYTLGCTGAAILVKSI